MISRQRAFGPMHWPAPVVAESLEPDAGPTTAKPDRVVETIRVESRMEHLRQRPRVTRADDMLQSRTYRYCNDRLG
jgi:Transmembrane secretion effector